MRTYESEYILSENARCYGYAMRITFPIVGLRACLLERIQGIFSNIGAS